MFKRVELWYQVTKTCWSKSLGNLVAAGVYKRHAVQAFSDVVIEVALDGSAGYNLFPDRAVVSGACRVVVVEVCKSLEANRLTRVLEYLLAKTDEAGPLTSVLRLSLAPTFCIRLSANSRTHRIYSRSEGAGNNRD